MNLFAADQIKNWDSYTIEKEPVASIDLMERAATACYEWLIKNNFTKKQFRIFCGKGNNGGDGLAIARQLIQNNCHVDVYILETGKPGAEDFQTNLVRLHNLSTNIHFIQSPEAFPAINKYDLVIDALFGTGLNKPLDGIGASLVEHINNTGPSIVSIDVPSGLYADKSSKNNTVINATHTLSFQNYKLAFLLPENELCCGHVHLLNIGLHESFNKNELAQFEMTDLALIKSIYKPRKTFAHKGDFGQAALVSGSMGMIGASTLSSISCLRSGAGKLTTYIPKCGYPIIQSSVPEAMCVIAGEDFIFSAPGIEKFKAIGIGPGIGLHSTHKDLLAEIFQKTKGPVVIDADALTVIAENPALYNSIPEGSILTPHPKEFERLFGKTENDFERLKLALEKSKALNIFIILKGHFSFIATPKGNGFFNSTGNPGMATAGSGDVLTGILTGLLAQGYSSLDTCLLGAYLHGLAGDFAANKFSQEAMLAGDIITHLGAAFSHISQQ